jgi:hypothetical protein
MTATAVDVTTRPDGTLDHCSAALTDLLIAAGVPRHRLRQYGG